MRFGHAKFVLVATSGRLIRSSDEESDVVEMGVARNFLMYCTHMSHRPKMFTIINY